MAEKKQVPLPMNAGLVEAAIRRHVDHRANILVPEAEIWSGVGSTRGSYRADFMSITKAGYGTELEVKISRADWKADLSKPKWSTRGFPSWVTRFIYVVPDSLGIPDFVPATAGVWHVSSRTTFLDGDTGRALSDGFRIQVARAPHVLGREKVPQAVINKWMTSFYYRYWDQRLHAERRIPKAIREGGV
jgi:hypothetical protein